LADPWQRIGARFVDALVFGVVYLVIGLSGLIATGEFLWARPFSALSHGLFLLSFVYEVAMVASRGQTIGKIAVGIKVTRVDGSRVDAWAALRRWAVFSVDALARLVPTGWRGPLETLGLIYTLLLTVMIVRDPNRQGLHDKAAGTIVVRVGRGPTATVNESSSANEE
jgi:uncharacterized RDD family membrane protein YckC